jgi:NADH:ubiquinone oxidoreductase subunit 2 (subunit N)
MNILLLIVEATFFYKQLVIVVASSNVGLFINDLNFFYFEIYFLFAIFIMLIFFVVLSNNKNYFSKYLNVSGVFLNISIFVILVLILLLNSSSDDSYYLFSGFYFNDPSAVFFKNLLMFGFLLFLFSVRNYLIKLKNYDFEFILVLIISLFSSTLLLNSGDLVSLFFIIELQSLSFYILVASKQTSSFSTESGLKYFILGCFSSGVILFGISLIYGFTGLLSYADLSLFVSSFSFSSSGGLGLYFPFGGLVVGLTLLTIGFLFKLGSVPFHM